LGDAQVEQVVERAHDRLVHELAEAHPRLTDPSSLLPLIRSEPVQKVPEPDDAELELMEEPGGCEDGAGRDWRLDPNGVDSRVSDDAVAGHAIRGHVKLVP
jgi:hypothetical protein